MEVPTIRHVIWCFDVSYVTPFSDVGGPLVWCTHPAHTLDDSLHEFKLWNIEMQNWTPFPAPPAITDDCILVKMKLMESFLQCVQVFVVDKEALSLKYEFDECSDGASDVRVYSSCGDSYDEFLEVTMLSACALFEF
jgi:hypothetical protein